MSYPINYPTPQNANVQIFYALPTSANRFNTIWTKPQGASFVWFTLIGAGGSETTTGGGSGAVTNFMCPAFLIPDNLVIEVANSAIGNNTNISYVGKPGGAFETYAGAYTLLTAESGVSTSQGFATSANYFTAMGFYQSISGQSGSAASISASATTFLSGGGEQASSQASNYGYTSGSTGNRNGFFQMQPIIVGAGGMGTSNGGIGCGAGYTSATSTKGKGGNGMVVIITW